MEVVPPWPGCLVADVAAGLAPVHGSPSGQFWTLAGSRELQLEQRAALLQWTASARQIPANCLLSKGGPSQMTSIHT